MYERLDRETLRRWLRAYDQAHSTVEIRQWLRSVLASDDIDVEADDERLLFTVVADLDSAETDERLHELARDYADVLDALGSRGSIGLLAIVRDRNRIFEILTKVLDGRITRTGFLSFLTEQRWPRETRDQLSALGESQLHRLLGAVAKRDYAEVAKVID